MPASLMVWPRDRVFTALVLALAAALLTSGSARAGAQARTQLPVSATIVDRVQVRATYQAERIVVAAEDVRRGYVEVAAASRFDVRCARLCLFEFRPIAGFVRAVRVSGLSEPADFGAAGGSFVHSVSESSRGELSLHYRFTLARDVAPGAYAWPVALTVLPM